MLIINVKLWVSLGVSEHGVSLPGGNFDREHAEKPVDLGLTYFQTNPYANPWPIWYLLVEKNPVLTGGSPFWTTNWDAHPSTLFDINLEMGVSINRGTPSYHPFLDGIFPYKPSIFGYHHFRNPQMELPD